MSIGLLPAIQIAWKDLAESVKEYLYAQGVPSVQRTTVEPSAPELLTHPAIMKHLLRSVRPMPKKLHLGCGPDAPSGWVNVDGSLNAWFSSHPYLRRGLETVGLIGQNQGAQWKVRPLVHDLTKPLPFKENSFSAVYASHVLEHLYRTDAQRLLSECCRVLEPGGVVRVVVPDLRSMATTYLNNKLGNGLSFSGKNAPADRFPADKFNEMLMFRSPAPPGGNLLYRLYSVWKDFHHHKWMYDSDSLVHYVEEAGFTTASEKGYLQSEIPGIAEVENPERVLDGAGVCVEAKKR